MGEARLRNWRIIEDFADLQAIEPAWRALHERSACPRLACTPEWLSTWWRVFGASGGRRLCVIAIASGGELTGLVPLVRRRVWQRGLFPTATLEWLGTGEPPGDDTATQDAGPLAARGHEAEVARAAADALLSAVPQSGALSSGAFSSEACSSAMLGSGGFSSGALRAWDELHLARTGAGDPVVPLLAEALRERGVDVHVLGESSSPWIQLPGTWDAYLAQLGARRRALATRTLDDLAIWAGPGGLVLHRAESLRDLTEAWRHLRALHGERWRGGGALRSERLVRFHTLLTSHLLRGEGGTLDLTWLEVRGRPVAALYDIVHRGTVIACLSGRSLDVPRQVRLGIAMHLLAIRRAIERGDRVYDLLAPEQPYKRELAPAGARRLVTLSATAPTLRARSFRAARWAAGAVTSLTPAFHGRR